MKIIMIAGTWYSPGGYAQIWGNLMPALQDRYPDATFVYKHAWYQPWDVKKILSVGEQTVLEEDTGEDILLLGHSMGGVTACGIASQFKKSRVRGVATIFSPHTMGWWLPFLNFKEILYPEAPAPQVPVISFGGWFDPLVWFFFTRHPQSVRHTMLLSDHRFMLAWDKRVASLIAETVHDIVYE